MKGNSKFPIKHETYLKGGKMKERKTFWIVLVMAILLLAALIYIGIDVYSNWKADRENAIYEEGALFGLEQTVLQIAQMASTCQQVPLVVGNQTMNIIWVDCLTRQ